VKTKYIALMPILVVAFSCIMNADQKRETVRVFDQEGSVLSVAISPDGETFASASGTMTLWSIESRERTTTREGGPITAVGFSPDGKWLGGSIGNEGHGDSPAGVRVWDAKSLKPGIALKGNASRIATVMFSPDSKIIAGACLHDDDDKCALKLWDIGTGEIAQTFKQTIVEDFAFAPDSRKIASIGRGKITIWDVRTGKVLHSILHKGTLQEDETCKIAWSRDGLKLASTGAGTLQIRDAEKLNVTNTLRINLDEANDVAFSNDSKLIAIAGGLFGKLDKSGENQEPHKGLVRIWDIATGKVKSSLDAGNDGMAYSLAFGQDGKSLVSGSGDGLVRLWNLS